ncbi:hypothetical protein Mgra_00007364 [Meloidogyne graminicola]|uniref:Protein pellino n=1 Tax=Meloidogyne graminicola TaxID=189291 RepID=A0A8S9ZJ72_9BILA|nr:hypothetical protein Mgra_00007364 [Meloidogyne graminicola]
MITSFPSASMTFQPQSGYPYHKIYAEEMEFGPHSSFIPHSPLSYSNSYVPQSSPTPTNNEKRKDVGVYTLIDEKQQNQQKTLQNPLKNLNARRNSRSILKNNFDGRGESNERKQQKTGSNYSLTSLSEKKSVNKQPPVQRKETLKTVAFGLTTNLDQTVLGKEGRTASTSRDSSRTKTIIFSHEAQSLHKLILEQKQQIDTLRETVDDLKEEQEKQLVGSPLATRLQEMEKQKTILNNTINTNNSFKNNDKKELPTTKSLTKVDKATSAEDFSKNKAENQRKEIAGDIVLRRRNDFLHRLEYEMDRNPVFEQRLHSMLRVWSEDSAIPNVIFNKNNGNIPVDDEGSCGPSMVMRVTTQRQEIFYSSPGRSNNAIRRFPRAEDVRGGEGQRRNFQKDQDKNNENTKPKIKVVELDDDGEEKENENDETDDPHHNHLYTEDRHQTINTMLRNVHRSDQIGTEEAAEFFRPLHHYEDGNNDDDDEQEFFGGIGEDEQHRGRQQNAHQHNQHFDDYNDVNNQHQHRYPFNRRRKREATSTIRNRYLLMEGNHFNDTDDLLIQLTDESSQFLTDECSGGVTQLLLCQGEFYYGQFVLLGYNGAELTNNDGGSSELINKNSRKHLSKIRLEANGIKKGSVVKVNSVNNNVKERSRSSKKHTVSFAYGKSGTVVVEYLLDSTKDMFQIGRSSDEQIDFTIVDTWIVAGNDSHFCGNDCRKSNHKNENSESEQKNIASTVSRYACRILAERGEPHRVQIFAAGFDSSRSIFLGEKAPKWQKKNGEFDGLTTNGVLILHPHWCTEDEQLDSTNGMYIWREVSVDGDIYTLRTARSSTQRGALVLGETNELQDGTLIDLCGATLLWRSAEGLKQSPSKAELERRLDELNAGKPICPVNLNTLVISRKRRNKSCSSSKQPYVYFRCGHVQGNHNWGVEKNGSTLKFKCPICLVVSDNIAQLTMGMESAFHLDSGLLEYAFNPCGHMASKRTVSYWSRITMPQGTNSFRAVCPFCSISLTTDKPFVRLIFQDHCYEC